MRLAGTLPNQHDAATFVDYLLTLGVQAKVERSGEAWELWIFDEDQLPQGREELQKFLADPKAAVYRDAAKLADGLRRDRLEKELAARRLQMNVPRPTMVSSGGKRPITMALLTASLVAFLLTEGPDNKVVQKFYITQIESFGSQILWNPKLPEIRAGEWWRLISPIFVHMDLVHLALNMWALVQFGTQIEMLRGWKRTLALVVLCAVPGNLAQFYFVSPSFGGMSGVIFGMFGYVWMKARFEPWSGFYMPPVTVFVILMWFFLGAMGQIGPMANYCHGVGLAMGLLLGYAPTLIRSLRRSQ